MRSCCALSTTRPRNRRAGSRRVARVVVCGQHRALLRLQPAQQESLCATQARSGVRCLRRPLRQNRGPGRNLVSGSNVNRIEAVPRRMGFTIDALQRAASVHKRSLRSRAAACASRNARGHPGKSSQRINRNRRRPMPWTLSSGSSVITSCEAWTASRARHVSTHSAITPVGVAVQNIVPDIRQQRGGRGGGPRARSSQRPQERIDGECSPQDPAAVSVGASVPGSRQDIEGPAPHRSSCLDHVRQTHDQVTRPQQHDASLGNPWRPRIRSHHGPPKPPPRPE